MSENMKMLMNTSRRHFLATTFGLLGGTTAFALADTELQQAITKGRQFLVDLFDPTLDLLPEYRGSQTYWLFHDNYLAAQVLRKSHPGNRQQQDRSRPSSGRR